ncbi:hypothetical protein GGQ92_001458 [Gracilibacillus halotolerans]|uniref:PucR C-terminal helix-turn-helix domain-containing protein n=1 Tax=Gracilibacillus halotolerans TaxID=74386 RepID=A0A841RL52_9BACI|nr:helix-turn-helix domain-containing protein [Gracilibacillus halotolerans]MBB6512672.1 hypothetical protein [Gracilibacillus halotolerans]
MLDQLQYMFPNLVKAENGATINHSDYKWFVTKENDIVGIPADDITQRELELLTILLTPYKANQPPMTEQEKVWSDILFHQHIPSNLEDHRYYFVYFSLSDETVDPDNFREAIYGIFFEKPPILWENNEEGVIIQEIKGEINEEISYTEIAEVLTTDFYMDVKLFVGPVLHNIKKASTFYQWMKNCYRMTRNSKQSVLSYIQSIPYIVLQPITKEERLLLCESLLHEVSDDEELLKTIQIFLESNSNTTLAAKKMYMHRNSLQYRVDKFIEKTGIDVKQFEGAIAVYLCLIIANN